MTGPLKTRRTPSLTCQHNQSLFSKRSRGHECLNFCLYVLQVSWKGWLKDLYPDNDRKGLSTSQIHPASYSLKQNFTGWLWNRYYMKRNAGQRADGTLLPRNSDNNIFIPKTSGGKQGTCSGRDRSILGITTHREAVAGLWALLGQYTHRSIALSPVMKSGLLLILSFKQMVNKQKLQLGQTDAAQLSQCVHSTQNTPSLSTSTPVAKCGGIWLLPEVAEGPEVQDHLKLHRGLETWSQTEN